MTTTVTALLVSHDGARWLPAVLGGLRDQTRPPERVVAVDTGSEDTSRSLLTASLGAAAVVAAPARTSYGEAVLTGLRNAGDASGGEWVWLLHDDSNPRPDALEKLLLTAQENPSASVLGPKLREWPSLRRLLEVGVTISGTGRRETGLESGEYDQGQHDQVRDVLAVNTAGMLIRRAVLEELGFDPRLPVFGNDIDLGWRAARAGHRTIVAPEAVVFHVEAARGGVRRTELTTGRPVRAQRCAALYTLLVNCSTAALPFQAVRLLLGSLLRALGLLLLRAPGEALDEVAAVASTYLRPQDIRHGRTSRRAAARVSARDVRHLLPPPWLPYRHGMDLVGEVAVAVTLEVSEASARRESRAREAETGPLPAGREGLATDTGLPLRLLRSPLAWLIAVLVVVSVVADRGRVGVGGLAGGALLPAPGGARDWWHLYLESWHDVGVGSGAPAAAYLLPMALLSSLLLGKAWLVVDLLFLLAVPAAAIGAHRFLRLVTRGAAAPLWGGLTYGLLPVLSGSVQQGRLGSVVGVLVLPWLARSAVFLAPGQPADRRHRAAWRTSLWLALLCSFVPLAWVLAAVTAVVAVAVGALGDRRRWISGAVVGPVVLPLVVSAVLLLPWSLLTWTSGGIASLLFEAGLPAPQLTVAPGPWDLVLGRPGSAGAPAWLGVGVVVAALLALLRPDTRPAVLRAWTVLVVALAVTVVVAPGRHAVAGSPVEQPVWLGFPILVAQAAGISAAALAGDGVRAWLSGRRRWQPAAVAVVALALVASLAGLLWWVADSVDGLEGPLTRRAVADLPAYMTDAALANPTNGILELRGSSARGFGYQLLRGPGPWLGQDTVQPTLEAQAPLTAVVTSLVTSAAPADVHLLARFGVAYVYLPPPADTRLVGNLDSLSGVTAASATRPGARAWQLQGTASDSALPAPPSTRWTAHRWLLVVQALALVLAVVLAAPSRRSRR